MTALQSLWSRVGPGTGERVAPAEARRHAGSLHTCLHRRSDHWGAREGVRAARPCLRAPELPPGVARKRSAIPSRARVLARPPPRAPLPMVAPRARPHPRPCGPIEYVTLLVPRGEQDAPPQPHALPMPVNLPMPLPMPMPPVVPRPPLQSCINLQSRVAYPHNPSTCLASHLYPTPVADKPQANDQKDGERARAPSNRRPVPRARRRAPVSD